ncbi:MAG: hypothetical protein V7L04_08205 [Nostoc sp.]|uniref:hypothetical protein n=1 Tax=Nostoc sp. TaxID=1180 RepID=UPI002FFB7E02
MRNLWLVWMFLDLLISTESYLGESNVILEIQLVSDFKMPMVEVWLGLLLGGFTLEQRSNLLSQPKCLGEKLSNFDW